MQAGSLKMDLAAWTATSHPLVRPTQSYFASWGVNIIFYYVLLILAHSIPHIDQHG